MAPPTEIDKPGKRLLFQALQDGFRPGVLEVAAGAATSIVATTAVTVLQSKRATLLKVFKLHSKALLLS